MGLRTPIYFLDVTIIFLLNIWSFTLIPNCIGFFPSVWIESPELTCYFPQFCHMEKNVFFFTWDALLERYLYKWNPMPPRKQPWLVQKTIYCIEIKTLKLNSFIFYKSCLQFFIQIRIPNPTQILTTCDLRDYSLFLGLSAWFDTQKKLKCFKC